MKVLSNSNWYVKDNVCVKAQVYYQGRFLTSETFCDVISAVTSDEEFESVLKRVNGQFAVIINKKEYSAAAIDPSRIFPLFFSFKDGEILISDSAEMVLPSDAKISEESLVEYNFTGATFAGKALIEGLFQIKPGHILTSDGRQMPLFRYNIKSENVRVIDVNDASEALKNAFKRTFDSIGGRRIVIPLSGGYDSRVIACEAKLHGCENVLCYTYGSADSFDCRTAMQVAGALGFKIIHIDTAKLGVDLRADSDFDRYVDFMGGYTNFLWVNDYVACRHLIETGAVGKDAVFIPGHLGNFLAGSHIQKCRLNRQASSNEMAEAIMRSVFEFGYAEPLRERLVKYFDEERKFGDYVPSLFMSFILQNRKAHNIDNAARLYEFLGFGVRLPFWDKELLELFSNATIEQLMQRQPYNECVVETLFKPLGVDFSGGQASGLKIKWQLFKDSVKRVIPQSIIDRLKKTEDCSGELQLVKSLQKGLSDRHKTTNEILKEWYLERINY